MTSREGFASLAAAISAGVAGFLLNALAFQAIEDSRKPFESVEDSFTPLWLGATENFIGGLIVASILIIVGRFIVSYHVSGQLKPLKLTSAVLNVVLFASPVPALIGTIALINFLLPKRPDFGSLHPVLAPAFLWGLIAGLVITKILLLRRAFRPATDGRPLVVFWSIVLYGPLLLLTAALGSPLLEEVGWAARIAAAEAPGLAFIVWLWIVTGSRQSVAVVPRGTASQSLSGNG